MQPAIVHDTLDKSKTLRVTQAANEAKDQPRSASFDSHAVNVADMAKYLSQSRVTWNHNQCNILIVTKARDNSLVRYTRHVAQWLIMTPRFGKAHPFTVYVDCHLEHAKRFKYQCLVESNPIFAEKLKFWTPKLCRENPGMFHLIITLGGDGTVLFTSWLFQTIVPPVFSIHLGSLSFLTPFPYSEYRLALNSLFEGEGYRNTVRMRLSCTVYRYIPGQTAVQETPRNLLTMKMAGEPMETAWMKKQLKQEARRVPEEERIEIDKQIPCYTTVPDETYEVLNELVVDRGPSSYMSMLELFGGERHLTTVQADGLCIATPTGSTAYSLSAQGSLTHPDLRAILVTPICPHALSFRPMLLPETMTIRIVVPFGARNSAYCSFDGRNRVELKQGDHVKVTASQYPLPTVCRNESSADWFTSLQESLQWNARQRQKSFAVLESSEEQKLASPELETTEENVFACIKRCGSNKCLYPYATRRGDMSPSGSSVSTSDEADEDNENEEQFDIPGWNEEELRRFFPPEA